MIIRTEYGHPLQGLSALPTLAQLKALAVGDNVPGEVIQLSDGRFFQYNATSVLTADDIFVVAPTVGAGRYLLAPGFFFDLSLAVAFGTADAAVLATLPTNGVALLGRSYWEITADWTGGSSSAIGISSGQAPNSTKGDLLGGASGDVAATLVASGGKLLGTAGAKVAGGILMKSATTIRFDRVTSAFTTGAGFAHIVGTMLANPGV